MTDVLTSEIISIGGKKVHYYTNGVTEGNPIIILHGFMSDAASLIPFAEALGSNRPIILPDLPGFGMSDGPDKGQGLRWYVDWLHEFTEAIGVHTPILLCGYSFGAYLAVLYTCLFSKQTKVERLVLLTPVVKINWQVRIYGRGFRLMAIRAKNLAERLYLLQYDLTTMYLAKSKHPAVRSQVREQRRGELEYLDAELVLRLFSEFLVLNLLQYAKKIKSPTVIVTASNDNVAAASATRAFAAQISRSATVVDVHHAGHLLPVEEPQLLGSSLKYYFS